VRPALIVPVLLGALAHAGDRVVDPEGVVPLPAAGLEVRVPAGLPVFAVASTTWPDGGVEHALVWEAQNRRTWLYQPTQLTFFSVAGPGTVRVVSDGGLVEAPGAQRFTWPEPVKSFALSPVSGSIFVLDVFTGSGCPGRHVEHWLQVRGGRVSELLTTGGSGEGAGAERWFEGSVAFWGGVPDAGDALPLSAAAFAPIRDVPRHEQVVVFEERVEQGRLCSATRTVSRYRAGALQQVRVDSLRFDGGRPSVCGD
jgi:hypothetical protein